MTATVCLDSPEWAAARTAPPPRRHRWSPGLIDLYLIRGVAGPFLLLVLLIGTAMILERALRLINSLAGSGADLGYFFPILAHLVPYYLDLAIPAAFMVALVLLVARLDDRLELEAMLASGLSMSRIAAPLVGFGIIVAAASLAVSGWLEPFGRYGVRTLTAEATNAGLVGRLQPRSIYRPADSLALTFDRRAADGGIAGIFVWQRLPDGRELVLSGGSGRVDYSTAGRAVTVTLREGMMLAERPGHAGSQRFAFHEMTVRQPLQLVRAAWHRGRDQKELTLSELAADLRATPAHLRRDMVEAELYGRAGRAVLVAMIPLIVLPLAMTTKKGRRGLGVLMGGVLLALLNHGLNFVKQLTWLGHVHGGTSTLTVTFLGAAIVLLVFVSGRQLPSHSPIHDLLKPIGSILGRFRRKDLPAASRSRARVLTAYFASQLGRWTALAMIIAVLLLQMVDLFDRTDDLLERGQGLAGVAYYSWLQLPFIAQQALPLAALAGAMVVFASLGRGSEMTAIRAAGMSQWRILLLALPVPLFLCVVTLGLSEAAVPDSQGALARWWAGFEPKSPASQTRWFRVGMQIVAARDASKDGRTLSGIRIYRRDAAGRLVERIAAERAVADGRSWILQDADRMRVALGAPGAEPTTRLLWPVSLLPSDVAAFFASTRILSYATAARALDAEAPVSAGDSFFATRTLRLAAQPLAPLLMLLLALPLAFVAPRTGVAWPATLYAAGGGLIYLVADGVMTVFAQVGYLPAPVGALAAPLAVLLGGVVVLVFTER